MTDWGADVIKVEHAENGDAQRGLAYLGAVAAGGNFAPLMEHPNRGKRSIGLALEHPEALEVLYELVRDADVFLTNFLGDARSRLRIDVEHIREVNPDIIYVRGTALGARGPEAHKGGYDQPTFWCRAGSSAGVTPVGVADTLGMPGPAYGDTLGGMTIAGGVAAALYARASTGKPSVVDVSLLSVGAWANALAIDLSMINGEPWSAPPTSSSGRGTAALRNPLVGLFRTSDGRYINLNMMQPGRYWADTCRHLGREDLISDGRFSNVQSLMDNAQEAADIIGSEIARRTFAECLEQLETLEGQWAPVQNSVEVARDPQLRANGYIAQVIDVDGKLRELVANPVQFDEHPVEMERAPQFAEHTDEILAEYGRDQETILELKIAGAVT